MTSNVIPLPKREPKNHSENCLFIVKRKDGWVDYNLGEVLFQDDKPFGYAHQFSFLQLDSIRARQIDDPEIIRDVVRNKLKLIKRDLEDALKAIDNPIVTFDEETAN